MRVIFAGTPEFAAVALAQLHQAGHDIVLVMTQPDRPAGRGMKLQASPVKQFALAHGLAVAQPQGLKLDGKYAADAAQAQQAIAHTRADVMVVAAYGLILPQWVLDAPRLGCLNIHASLLPRWRGAAPIHRAIEAGDAETGITIMQMDAGLDTGDMLLTLREPIRADDTTARLHDRLAALGGDAIVQALIDAEAGRLQPTPQPAEGVTYAHKIDKAEAAIDWRQSAEVIARRIRAFDPFPGATAQWQGETVKLWQAAVQHGTATQIEPRAARPGAHTPTDPMAAPVEASALASEGEAAATATDLPGQVLSADADGVCIACGSGEAHSVLRVTQLQRAGGKRLAAAEFLRGFALVPGLSFEVNA